MLMMSIRIMGMLVLERRMLVPMAVRATKNMFILVRCIFIVVIMLVMGVVIVMRMLVCIGMGIVNMRVAMVFTQVQQGAQQHQNSSCCKWQRKWLFEQHK